jgi:hypothetical protein
METQEVPVVSAQIRREPVRRSTKPFKHFAKDLNLNTEFLASYLLGKEKELKSLDESHKLGVAVAGSDEARMWESSGSLPTVAWRDYNVFQFHDPAIYDLLRALGDLTREACEYYELDFERHRFMVQGWFNVNYAHSGKLDWHTHSHLGAPQFHGYYCVRAEPSSTHYMVDGEEVVVVNKNNRALLGESLHEHAMGDWAWDGPRVTIAYDIAPLRGLETSQEQHYVPLP